MYFVQLKVDFRDFPWFCKVLGAPAGPAGPEPPEASRAAAEQSLSEDLEDFLSSEQGFGRFFKLRARISKIFNCRRGFRPAGQPGAHWISLDFLDIS